MDDDPGPGKTRTWGAAAATAVRQLAIATLAGVIAGFVIGGIGGRLAMFLLARLNPQATGVLSDDGFVMGQFTMSGTLNLLAVATVLGALGGAIYLAVRTLRIGPTWFRYASVAVGAGVTVAAVIVQEGVDFTLLQPAELAIALFVAIPAAYAVLLQWIAERWLDPRSTLMTTSKPFVYLPALVLLPFFPLWVALGAGWGTAEYLRRSDVQEQIVRIAPWIGRLILTLIFVVGITDLIKDINTFA